MDLQLSIENELTGLYIESLTGMETWMVYESDYREGDRIVLRKKGRDEGKTCHILLQLDDAMAPALVYLKNGEFQFPVPYGDKSVSYSPRAFSGSRHYLYARYADPFEFLQRRNLAFNPYDLHGESQLFPHASANVETRGESVFAAKNAIDGYKANSFHGEWPFTSWGINQNPDASLTIDFGRPVRVDSVVFYLRADFPHDSWWTSGTVHFSDHSSVVLPLVKSGGDQTFEISSRVVEWVRVDTLIKGEDSSPFPALTQLEVWGSEWN